MNWEAVGAIGEVGGALGVVLTLIYLAAQLRQNSQSLEHNSDAVQAATELENARLAAEWNHAIAADRELAGLFDAAYRQELDPIERLRFRFLMASLFYRFEGLYRQWQRGLLSDEAWGAWQQVIRNTLARSEARTWWSDEMHPFSASFRAAVDQTLEESRV